MKSLFKKIILAKFHKSHLIRFLVLWYNFRFTIQDRLIKQLSIKSKKEIYSSVNQKRVLIPIIETKHYQHFQLLAIAKALQLRGAEIKIIICGQFLDGCEIKSALNEKDKDPCLECRFNELNILPLFNVEVLRLSDIITKEEKSELLAEAEYLANSKSDELMIRHGIDLKQSVEDSIIRYFYGAVPDDESLVNKVRINHFLTAIISAEVAYRIDQSWSPDIVFNNMYSYSAWGPFFHYYRNIGSPFITISINNFNYHANRINTQELFESTERYRKYLSWRGNNILNTKENNTLKNLIHNRFKGESRFFKDYNYFRESPRNKPINELLKINKNKKNLFLFSNVYWDFGISIRIKLFKGVLDWIIQTIEIVKKEPNDIHLYIKPHPGEKRNSLSSKKGISEFIVDNFSKLPQNITIIDPEWEIKSYELFPYIDLGVMYNGTLGLEMMLSDIPVVTTAKSPYQGLKFSLEPDTIEEYKKVLIDRNQPIPPDKKQLELFAYFYFIKTMVPFGLTKQVYADDFNGFTIKSLEDLLPGNDKYLDHLCNCILDSKNTIIEGWN